MYKQRKAFYDKKYLEMEKKEQEYEKSVLKGLDHNNSKEFRQAEAKVVDHFNKSQARYVNDHNTNKSFMKSLSDQQVKDLNAYTVHKGETFGKTVLAGALGGVLIAGGVAVGLIATAPGSKKK